MSVNSQLLILFGPPGVGKSYIGALLQAHHGFHFYDADADLTPEMIHAIQQKKVFTQAMRDTYFALVSQQIALLKEEHPKLVVAQALAKECNRQQLHRAFPDAQFIRIHADEALIDARIKSRNDWITPQYAAEIRDIFEPAQLPHKVLDNTGDHAHLYYQYSKFWESISNH